MHNISEKDPDLKQNMQKKLKIMVFCGNKQDKSTFENYSKELMETENIEFDSLHQNNWQVAVELGDNSEDFNVFLNN